MGVAALRLPRNFTTRRVDFLTRIEGWPKPKRRLLNSRNQSAVSDRGSDTERIRALGLP